VSEASGERRPEERGGEGAREDERGEGGERHAGESSRGHVTPQAPAPAAPTGQAPAPPAPAHAIGRGVRLQLVSRAAVIGASLAGQVAVARLLGPEGNGLLASATTVLAVGMLAADLGVNTAASRALAQAFYQDPRAARRIARTGLALKLVLTGAVAAAMALFAGPIARALGGGDALAPLIAWAGLQLVLDNLATYSFRGLQGLHRDGPLAFVQALSGVGSPLLAAALVSAGMGPPGAIVGRAAGAGIAAVAGVAGLLAALRALGAIASQPKDNAADATSGDLVRELARYARQILWVNVAFLVFFRLDQALVQLFLGVDALGLYNPAASIVEKCLLPVASIATVAAPRFAAIADPAAHERLRALFASIVRSTTLLYAPAAAGLALLAPDAVVAVFGAPYTGAGPVLRAYGAALLLLAHATLLGQLLDYLGKGRARALAFLGAALADIACNVWLLPRIGIVAPVASLALTFTPLVLFYGASVARALAAPLRPVALDLGAALLGAGVMAAAITLARPPEGTASLPALAGLVALGALVYGGVVQALGRLDARPHARRLLARLPARLRPRGPAGGA